LLGFPQPFRFGYLDLRISNITKEFKSVVRSPLQALSDFAFSKLISSCEFTTFNGIRIGSVHAEAMRFTNTVIDALELIGEHDSRRFRVLKRTTDIIIDRPLAAGSNAGVYRPKHRAISIDFGQLPNDWTAIWQQTYFAGLLIHEATHGRIAATGIPTTNRNRIQIERICTAEENRFYERLRCLDGELTDYFLRPFAPSLWEDIWSASLVAKSRTLHQRFREKSKKEQGHR
jgi:hypothetical protein